MRLWQSISASGAPTARVLRGATETINLAELQQASSLGGRLEELRGRTVLVGGYDQFTAAVALIELDGVARRIVLCPPDLPASYLPEIARNSGADAWVADSSQWPRRELGAALGITSGKLTSLKAERRCSHDTEWVLLTSGTTGAPKLVLHTLRSLTSAFAGIQRPQPEATIWATFYDIRRYGGLQVFLRGLHAGSLVLSSPGEATLDFLDRLSKAGVTHISGTPSHWRKALMSGATSRISPQYVRLSGETADQGILDGLRACFPAATLVHAFASTEAGVGFEVRDRLAGIPASLLEAAGTPVSIDVTTGTLRLRSAGNAECYLGATVPALKDLDGFVNTGDKLELRGGRYYFVGRSGGVINVGGLKTYPEEVETVINSHPWVYAARVGGRKNPITGAVVAAEVVLKKLSGERIERPPWEQIEREIKDMCRKALAVHKVPVTIKIVPQLEVSPSGKLVRSNA